LIGITFNIGNTMSTKKVLITGIAGLLGSRLTDWIIQNEPDVHVVGVDDLSGGYVDNVNEHAEFHKIDVAKDVDKLNILFETHKFDVVYHFAAYAAEALSPFIRTYNYTNNLVATSNLINASIKHDVKRFVFTSTMAVYGDGTPPFSETSPRNPIDPYGVAKMACEMDLEIAGVQHGLDWCIIRPHNMYGAKQNIWDSYRNVLGIWMYKKLHVSIKEAAHTLAEVVGGADVIHLPPRHEVKYAYPTYQKSIDLLGFEHKTNLYDGLKKMWEWAQLQPDRPRQVWSSYELDKGIYPFWDKTNLLTTSAKVVEL